MKVQLFSILISLFSSFAFTQTIKPRCLEGNCKNKIGTYLYSDSSIYVGSFSDKLRNGQGKITYKSGATYEGEWVNDKRHGQGVFIDSLKNKYEGAWLEDKENGAGKYTDAKGNVYEGTWTNGELKGYITLRYRNKNLYEGEYDKGLRGKGKFTYADGSVYTGNFAKNKRSGYGEMSYHFGLTYKGNWVSNEIEGQGDFIDTKSQRKLASGIWKTEKSKEGDLILLCSDGYMVCYYANKDLYFGQSANLLPHGEGFMGYANGERYEGKFDSGKYNGYGRYLYKDKSEYKGEWKNGQRDGFGTLVKKDKAEEKGYWKKGKYLGKEKPNTDGLVLINGIQGIKIGEQVWMSKNLNVERFRNGDLITHAKTNEEWKQAGERGVPAWCYYDNDPINGEKYGKIYNWYAVSDSRGLAPYSWHIPNDSEWLQLINTLGGQERAGAKLKENVPWCIEGYLDFDYRSLKQFLFNAIPGGQRLSNGVYNGKCTSGYWFCSTENYISLTSGDEVYLQNLSHKIFAFDSKETNFKKFGFSVRCISVTVIEDDEHSQEKVNLTDTKSSIDSRLIEEPLFPGGISAQLSFIQKNFRYPNIDLQNNVQGKVEVTFRVESDGSITNIRISKGLTETTNAEAIRVVKLMPKWIPGTIDGVKSKQEVTLPINFSTF
uniref:TonB family protein n=2 Tax=Flavobacterium sp. TaxID=239 RepID=UPI00404A1350